MKEERIIFHADVNSAFLSWEAAYRIHHLGGKLDLRDVPSAIGGDVKMRHGIILAKSIPAKRYGISTGMTVAEARQRCPGLYLAPPNYGLYQRCSDAFLDILREYTPDVEVYSIDEAFLDMTETLHLFGGDAVKLADRIRGRVREELGFTVNIGISTNRLLAKMAGDLKKPDYTHTLYPAEIKEKMWPLPVSELFFCGHASTKKLVSLGINTIGDLAHAPVDILTDHLKKQGMTLWNFANGRDFSSVAAQAPPQKGYGNSTTTPYDITDPWEAKRILLALSETVGARLRKDGVKAGCISVGVRDCALVHSGHQMQLKTPTDITLEIWKAACRLYDECHPPGTAPVRQLGIHAGKLCGHDAPRQLSFFDRTDHVKLETLDRTVDAIRRRYGNDSVFRAVFAAQGKGGHRKVDHMEGGVSREKRTVDYTKLKIE